MKLRSIIAILLLFPAISAADSGCGLAFFDEPFERELASSGLFANLSKSNSSIAYKLKVMLDRATASIAKRKRPTNASCPAQCKPAETPTILLSTTPNKVLDDYSDRETCAAILDETKKAPITFAGREFQDLETLNSYLVDLCQGKNPDGELLYEKCHSSCSPQYSSTIESSASGFKMGTEIVCGHARDKSDGQYQLATTFRWSCQEEK